MIRSALPLVRSGVSRPLATASVGRLLWPSCTNSGSSSSSSPYPDRPHRQTLHDCPRNRFSTSPSSTAQSSTSHGLFLWVGGPVDGVGDGDAPTEENTLGLLLPVPPAVEATVFSPEDILEAVRAHYAGQDHFVGGMGEEDGGVWFAIPQSNTFDTLDYADTILREGIAMVKEERHGVPFGLYTSGLPTLPSSTEPGKLGSLRLSTLQVSLFAANPSDYQKATGRTARDFGRLCAFIAQAVEEGVAVEASVLEEYQGSARDLALALGARHVHVRPKAW